MTHNIIIGAGISGLALGWYLKQQNNSVTILEADNRVGGWIRSERVQGFLFEQGPRSCRIRGSGIETLRLIEELDLCEEVISASPAANKRFVYWDGKLQALPNTLGSFFLSPLMKGVLPALCKEWFIPPSSSEDESIENFISRRLTKEIADRLMDPLVSGIYAGDISKLSVRSCFPDLYRNEQEHGSLLKGMFRKKRKEELLSPFAHAMRDTSIFSFANGMETLVTALHDHLNNEVHLSSKVKALNLLQNGVEVILDNGTIMQGDRIFLAIPSYVAAQQLRTIDGGICNEMEKISYASVAAVNVGWNQKVLKHEGFGYLVPSSQKQEVLGVVFDSSALAQQNDHDQQTRLTVMLGGTHNPSIKDLSDEEIKEITFSALQRHLGIREKPEAIQVIIANDAIPQYEVGHEARLLCIEERLKLVSGGRISLLGSAWRGVSVNDCIAEAKKISVGLK